MSRKAIASQFIEYLSAYGNEKGVRWAEADQWSERLAA